VEAVGALSAATTAPAYQRYRVLWPLVPAMAMVMIDFTIVSISATTIQRDLGLSSTGVQWLVTAYALATAAFIALGGRLGDIVGHKRIVAIGIVTFAGFSLICGLAPDTSVAEPWLIVCRVLQGLGGALLIPSATVLVLNAFPPSERGKGLAVFFIVAGLFTALGPIAGSYLTQYWTWRAVFWINVPVALLSLTEFALVKMPDVAHPARIDWGGAFLSVAGMGLTVLGIQQSTVWGWGSVATIGSIVAGVVLLVAFVGYERSQKVPLIDVRALAASRPFLVDCILTLLLFFTWLAVFFFGSIYFQVSVGQSPTRAGFSILTMFYAFFVASRIGGGMLDKTGPKHPVTLGFLALVVGLWLWGNELPDLSHSDTLAGMLVTGAGFGLAMSALNTDALDRAPAASRGVASGVIQSFRNFGSALGMAILGTIILSDAPDQAANGGTAVGKVVPHALASGFADSLQNALYVGAALMLGAFVLARFFMPAGRQADVE
jgi:EmrB/QacA subfamily drug resistance transporter